MSIPRYWDSQQNYVCLEADVEDLEQRISELERKLKNQIVENERLCRLVAALQGEKDE